MVFKSEKGSATIEGAIIFPCIFLFCFIIIRLAFFFFSEFTGVDSSAYAIRQTGQTWYENKTLYGDLFSDFDFTKETEAKKEGGKLFFEKRARPQLGGRIHSDFSFQNYGVWKTLSVEMSGNSLYAFSGSFSYPVIPAPQLLRSFETGQSIMDDCLEMLGQKKEGKNDDKAIVYIVDDGEKEYDYKKVYHLDKTCFYLRKGYKNSLSKEKARQRGFRPCRICLGQVTGLDE